MTNINADNVGIIVQLLSTYHHAYLLQKYLFFIMGFMRNNVDNIVILTKTVQVMFNKIVRVIY